MLDALRWFVDEQHILSCLSVTGGSRDQAYHAAYGRIREKDASGEDAPLTTNSLFDLASITKLFTALTVFRLREEGLLDLQRPVTDYAPQFSQLRDVSVETVLTFGVALRTPSRVDTQPEKNVILLQN